MAAVIENQVYIVNIGDSRAYLLRDNDLRQITKDHTIAQAFVDQGLIEQDEVSDHPYSNVLSQALGVEDIDGDVFTEQVNIGDYLLLCSDGLYGYVTSDDITSIITQAETPQIASDELTKAANQGGGKDNIAVIVVELLARER